MQQTIVSVRLWSRCPSG